MRRRVWIVSCDGCGLDAPDPQESLYASRRTATATGWRMVARTSASGRALPGGVRAYCPDCAAKGEQNG